MTEIDLQNRIVHFLHSAGEKFFVKNYDDAIRDLKAAEVLDKNNPEILFNLGINYCRKGLHRTSVEYFEKVLGLPFKYVEILTLKKMLAFALISSGSLKEADRRLDEVLELVPADTVALNMKGYSLEKQGKIGQAMDVYKNIIKIDKNNYNAYNSLAYLIAKNGGNLNEAQKYANKAVAASPENPAYLDTIGYIYMKKGRVKEAMKYLYEARKRMPVSEEIQEHINELKITEIK